MALLEGMLRLFSHPGGQFGQCGHQEVLVLNPDSTSSLAKLFNPVCFRSLSCKIYIMIPFLSVVVLITMLSAANNREVNSNWLKKYGNLFAHLGISPEVKWVPGSIQLGLRLQFSGLCPLLMSSFVIWLISFAVLKSLTASRAVYFLLYF